ncbi:urea transporter [Iningainema tapete]|uniref:Urea transporter n=1 Tax=Iningainema tapete BLCC-T55 TaxID=2748662 RepID=A0A8J7C9D1_9CYAN|nr:urea transporter [Iningainema tapete]MBD2777974.1 urea transporter [Iningainema tapete BLCC-T55]
MWTVHYRLTLKRLLPITQWTMKRLQTPRLVRAMCAATAEILFLRGVGAGALLLSAMLLQPAVLLMGLTGVLATVAFARMAKLGQTYLEWGPFLFNPLLAGLGVGYLFQPSAASIFLAAAAGILAFVLTWTLSHVLHTFFLLPVLSLPFVAVSWTVHLAAFRFAGLQLATVHSYAYSIGLPVPIEGFLRTLGMIFFLPNVWIGIIVALLLLLNSRIQFLLALSSYAFGSFIQGILTGTFAYVYYDPGTLNFILVALALGGFYLLPSPRSYLLAALGVALAVLLGQAIGVFWAAVLLPVHALPYNLVTMMLLYLLGLVGHQLLARYPQSSPEKTLDYELTARRRYRGSTGRLLGLPFAGSWVVWQGFDGKWTHQGLWRYAYDFLIQDDLGLTYRDAGLQLTDYYAWKKPVLSPIRGWVVHVVRDLPDCDVGSVDQDHNWGNYVMLYDERGFYVEISHFAQNSIVVKQGDRIERGTMLGRCGNSGYSPQPHIHIQVQLTPVLGAATVPFSFASLLVNGEFCAEITPSEDAVVEPVASDRTLAQALTFPLDSQLHFSITQQGRAIGHLSTIVRMAVDGSFYLDSGNAKLFFSLDEDRFMFHRLDGKDPRLALLFLAIPRLPLARQTGQQWFDYLPISTVITDLRLIVYQFCSSFYPQLASAMYVGQWQSDTTLIGTVAIPKVADKIQTSATFDRDNQLVRVSVGDRVLVRQ